MKKIITTLFITILINIVLPHQAQTQAQAQAQIAQPIKVIMDKAKLLSLRQDAFAIVLGNPLIVDAAIQSTKHLVLTAKSFGTTNIIVLGKNNEIILQQDIIVTPHTNNLVQIYRRNARQTLSCSPICENSIVLGDENNGFQQVIEQVERRNNISKPTNRP